MKEQGIDQSVSEGVRTAYAEEQRAERQLALSQERSDQYHRAQDVHNSKGANASNDVRHLIQHKLEQEYGVSAREAHNMIENNDPRFRKVWAAHVNQKVANTLASVSAGKGRVTGVAAEAQLNNVSRDYENKVEHKNNENQTAVQDAASNKMGVSSFAQMKSRIEIGGYELQAKNYNITSQNDKVYQEQQQQSMESTEAKQQKVTQREEDRIGQGITSKAAGAVSKVITPGGIFGQIDAQVGGAKNPSTIKKAENN